MRPLMSRPRPILLITLSAALTLAATAHAQASTTPPTLLEYGIVGAVIAGAAGLLVLSWRAFLAELAEQRKHHQAAIDTLSTKHSHSVQTLFEAQREDSGETRGVLRSVEAALSNLRVELGKR